MKMTRPRLLILVALTVGAVITAYWIAEDEEDRSPRALAVKQCLDDFFSGHRGTIYVEKGPDVPKGLPNLAGNRVVVLSELELKARYFGSPVLPELLRIQVRDDEEGESCYSVLLTYTGVVGIMGTTGIALGGARSYQVRVEAGKATVLKTQNIRF